MDAKALSAQVCATLKAKGFQAYLVGGCVRDILLGRGPADYDVATDATPDIVQRIFPRSLAVGAQFGVIIVLDESSKENPAQVEVATFRSDVGYTDGRHPDRVVYATSPEEDVRRRDFTINGLLLNPETNGVLDFVGGRNDIESGVIRAIGDPTTRFSEDKLRMMRAVRFSARFNYAIEPKTVNAVDALAAQIAQVSAERLRDELSKILTEGAARRGFELLDSTDLLPHLLPEVSRMKGVPQPPQYHPEGDVWIHTLLMLEALPVGCSETLAWGVLLHDVGKPPTFQPAEVTGDRIRFNEHAEVGTRIAEAICRRLRFSNAETDQIAALV
ncbi:MAG TPA: HDIG domain-containing metalloprotein, partial [Candidatus Acidoferrales bacterium]